MRSRVEQRFKHSNRERGSKRAVRLSVVEDSVGDNVLAKTSQEFGSAGSGNVAATKEPDATAIVSCYGGRFGTAGELSFLVDGQGRIVEGPVLVVDRYELINGQPVVRVPFQVAAFAEVSGCDTLFHRDRHGNVTYKPFPTYCDFATAEEEGFRGTLAWVTPISEMEPYSLPSSSGTHWAVIRHAVLIEPEWEFDSPGGLIEVDEEDIHAD